MALEISLNADGSDAVSSSNPLVTRHLITGETKEVKVYLKKNDSQFNYDNVVVDLIDSEAGDGDQTGWIKFAADNAGAPGTYGSSLNVGSITTNVVPFWVKVTNPNESVFVNNPYNRSDLKIRITSKKYAIVL